MLAHRPDFNGDGYLDIYSSNGAPGIELLLTVDDNLWMNDGGSNHWLHLDLVGTVSNRSAVGARITMTIGNRDQTREVAAGSGYQSMDDLRVEFGLGNDTVADRVRIRWPSGCIQDLEQVAADQVLVVVEDCSNEMLREELLAPVASMFPLPGYDPLLAVQTWSDPQSVFARLAYVLLPAPRHLGNHQDGEVGRYGYRDLVETTSQSPSIRRRCSLESRTPDLSGLRSN